jgi:uncharacterized protein (DUF2236 family)
MIPSPLSGDEVAGPLAVESDRLREEELALLDRTFDGVGVLLAGLANVTMQLSWLEVGHGVAHSPVTSGQVFKHPFKRYRTTIGYLMVAQFGSPELRAAYRAAVNESHRPVHSGPDAEVKYNAFNRDLQLWVASCIYFGTRDTAIREYGDLTAEEDEVLLRAGARWATTLQVPQDMWHPNMDAFWDYWTAGLERASFDQTTAPYLRALMDFKFIAKPLQPMVRPLTWVNIGFLPAELREALGYQWSQRDQRRHDALLRGIGYASRPLPAVLRQAPARSMLWNIQLRHLLGRPLV